MIDQIIESYKISAGEWIPKLRVLTHYNDRVVEKVYDSWSEKFNSKEAADKYVLEQNVVKKCFSCGNSERLFEKQMPSFGVSGGIFMCEDCGDKLQAEIGKTKHK